MKYLIDAQILIWYQLDSPKLSKNSYEIILNAGNDIFVSQITLFEIAIKQKIGKLFDFDLPIKNLIEIILKDNFSILHIENKHIDAYGEIPLLENHKDPFDRLILATVFSENIPLISADGNFKYYEKFISLIEN